MRSLMTMVVMLVGCPALAQVGGSGGGLGGLGVIDGLVVYPGDYSAGQGYPEYLHSSQYGTSDVVARLLDVDAFDGNPRGRVNWSSSLDLLSVKSELNCGAIRFDVDVLGGQILDDLKALPQQLVSAGDAVLAAAPMVLTCQASPTLCAELKNFNLRLDKDLDIQANVCSEIDKFINLQAEAGRDEKAAEQRAVQECIVVEQTSGETYRDAVKTCTTGPIQRSYYNIARGIEGLEAATDPQNILEAAISSLNRPAVESENLYELLRVFSGDIQIGVDGRMTPVFPDGGAITTQGVAEEIEYRATLLACTYHTGTLRPIAGGDDPYTTATAYRGLTFGDAVGEDWEQLWREQLVKVIQDELDPVDIDHLLAVESGDFYPLCRGLGKSLAAATAKRLEVHSREALASMEANKALPEVGRRQLKLLEAQVGHLARMYEVDQSVRSMDEMKELLRELALEARRHRAVTAEAVLRGRSIQDSVWSQGGPCTDWLTCQ